MAARCATEAFSTTCAVHIEDCEGWWFSLVVLADPSFLSQSLMSLPPPPFLNLALKVLVSPEQQIVGEATPVSFECLVVGSPIHNISWARDLEALSPEKVRMCIAA